MYLDILEYARLSEEIKNLTAQAAVMQSLPEFHFSTDGSRSEYHSLVHNLNHLKGAEAELEEVNNKLRKHMEQAMPKLSKKLSTLASSHPLKDVERQPFWFDSYRHIVCHP